MQHTVDDMRRLAMRRLPRPVFDYLEGAAGRERGPARNRAALDAIGFEPRVLVDVSRRDLSVPLFGARLPLPVVIAPTGLNGVLRPDGDVILARVAARNGIPFALSTASTSSMETVAERAGGDLWFQLYVMQAALADSLVARADAAGYRTLVVTVDVPVGGRRPRDMANRFGVPFRPHAAFLAACALRPAWVIGQLRHGLPQLANLASRDTADVELQAALMRRQMDASFSWDDLARLRDRWPHRLLVKGVLHAADADRCLALGADGVVLSNHGGRQLEDAPAPIAVLARLPRARAGAVLVDGGFRSGADLAKALALGADAVLLGRAVLYGLAARGEDGVQAVLDILRDELDNTLALLGCANAAELGREHVDAEGPAPSA